MYYLIAHEEERGIILTPCVGRIQGIKVLAALEKTLCVPISESAFKAVIRTSVEPTLFGQLFQYAGKMALAEPPKVVEQYDKHRRKATKGLECVPKR